MSRDNSSIQSPPNENCFETPSITSLIPSRAPLNSIPDPSQCQSTHSIAKVSTSRSYDRAKSSYSDSNSAQSTPVRSVRRLSNVGGGSASLIRLPGGGKYGFMPRVSRGISVAIPHERVSADVPYFELDEDPSFWKDHNVQVDFAKWFCLPVLVLIIWEWMFLLCRYWFGLGLWMMWRWSRKVMGDAWSKRVLRRLCGLATLKPDSHLIT